MLRSMHDLQHYAIRAIDGDIGHVEDFYFDDEAWIIRYLVVETGSWLASRKVLIAPIAIGRPDWSGKVLPVLITQEQVRNSPDIDTAKPVSRQHEIEYLGFYGYPFYWGGAGLWRGGPYPDIMVPDGPGSLAATAGAPTPAPLASPGREADARQEDESHLRGCRAVTGYHVEAADGDIGHVDGFLVDEDSWAIRYMIVNTSNWWLGHQVLIAPAWIDAVNWNDATVSVSLTRQAVRDAPPYDPATELDREKEIGLYGHYGRDAYWVAAAERETDSIIP